MIPFTLVFNVLAILLLGRGLVRGDYTRSVYRVAAILLLVANIISLAYEYYKLSHPWV